MSAVPDALQEELDELRAQLARSEARNAYLMGLLREALHREFSPSTEKVSAEQARLFDELEGADEPVAEPTVAPIRVEGHERKKQGRQKLPAALPRVEVIHDLTDAEKICDTHECELTEIGEVTSEALEFQPAVLHVRKDIRKKYACPCYEGHIVTAAKSPSMIPKSSQRQGC